MPNGSTDILLVTVTEVEALAVIDVLREQYNRSFERRHIGDKTYYDLGVIGGTSLYMVQSEMGSSGSGGALLTVGKGIDALHPVAVIMIGIAFGVNPKKQRIGDILVSRQLLLYELQRVGADSMGKLEIRLRGDRPLASQWLLDKFRSGILDWGLPEPAITLRPTETASIDERANLSRPGGVRKTPRVHFGLVLSGEKLVDYQNFRDQLLQFELEAIGGEMEGAGLYVAANDRKVDWILIKAICDWADGNKSRNKKKRQSIAARNAALFTFHVVQHGGLARRETDVRGSPVGQRGIVVTNNAPNYGAQGVFNAPVHINQATTHKENSEPDRGV